MTEDNQEMLEGLSNVRSLDPLQYKIYKGIKGKFGALRLKLKRAYTSSDSRKPDGCVFLEAAPAIGPNQYDWENQKIVMALSITDIPQILAFLRNPTNSAYQQVNEQNEITGHQIKLFHDKGAGTADKMKDTKNLVISKYPDKDSFFVSLTQNLSGSTKNCTLPILPYEALAIGTLLQAAIPAILAW